MDFIKRNKEILIQIIVFSIIGVFLKKYYLLIFVFILLIILPFNLLTKNYIKYLNKFINFIGFVIKTIMFTMLFVFVICPLSLFKKKQKNIGFVFRNKEIEPMDFEKMW